MYCTKSDFNPKVHYNPFLAYRSKIFRPNAVCPHFSLFNYLQGQILRAKGDEKCFFINFRNKTANLCLYHGAAWRLGIIVPKKCLNSKTDARKRFLLKKEKNAQSNDMSLPKSSKTMRKLQEEFFEGTKNL